MRVLQARVCGVEVLLGYCCDKPGELRSRSARPALPSSPSAGMIWHAVLGGTNASPGSRMGSVRPCPLPAGDPCLRAAPEQVNAAGERFKGSECSLHQLLFPALAAKLHARV